MKELKERNMSCVETLDLGPDLRLKNYKTVAGNTLDLDASVAESDQAVDAVKRSDLNGLQVKKPTSPNTYLIDNGYRRLIPDKATWENLFEPEAVVIVDLNIDMIAMGLPVTKGAIIASASDNQGWSYMIDTNPLAGPLARRWVPSFCWGAYQFNHSKKQYVAPVLIDAIPQGEQFQRPTP